MGRQIIDFSTIFGILISLFFVGWAIYIGSANSPDGGEGFLNNNSILIVLGGTFFLTSACFSLSDVIKAHNVVLKTIFYYHESPEKAAYNAVKLADIARKKGILELQKYTDEISGSPFLYKAINLIIDGVPYKEAEKITRNEMFALVERHQTTTNIIHKAAEIAPAMGLIGTLVGLVLMLGNLSDPSSIGPSMAIAMLTTLYGAILSYMILTPIAAKLERNSNKESIIMQIYIDTLSSIGKGENPRRLEMLINAILPPKQRIQYFE